MRSRITQWWAVVLAVVLAGCGGPPELPRLGPDAVILAFGDSLTHGTGAGPEESYPAVLERLTDRRVINAGVPGELSREGRDRLPALLARHDPDLLILCHGGNDLLRARSGARTAENLRAMIETARGHDVPVVLVGVPEKGLWLSSAPFYGRLADEHGLPYLDETLPDIESDRSLKSDAIHPNAAGYRQLAEALADLLRRAGAL